MTIRNVQTQYTGIFLLNISSLGIKVMINIKK